MIVIFVLSLIGCVLFLVRLWTYVQRAFMMSELLVLLAVERWILARPDCQRMYGVSALVLKCRHRVLAVAEGLIDGATPVETVLDLHRVRCRDAEEEARKAA